MKKKLTLMAGAVVLTMSMLFAGCEAENTKLKSDGMAKEESENIAEEDKNKDDKKENDKTSEGGEKENNKTTEDDEKESDKTPEDDKDEEKEDNTIYKDWKKYNGNGYTMYLSKDWTETDMMYADMAFANSKTAGNGFADNINSMVQDLSIYDMDLEGYKDLSVSQYDAIEGYTLDTIEKVKISGTDGYKFEISVEADSVTVVISQYFTVKDKKAYLYTFTADEDDYPALSEEFETIISMVKIN